MHAGFGRDMAESRPPLVGVRGFDPIEDLAAVGVEARTAVFGVLAGVDTQRDVARCRRRRWSTSFEEGQACHGAATNSCTGQIDDVLESDLKGLLGENEVGKGNEVVR